MSLLCAKLLQSCLTLQPYSVAHQAPLSVGFSRQESWSELPCFPPGGLKPASLTSPALAGGFFITSTTWEATLRSILYSNDSKTPLLPSLNSQYAYR